MSLDDIRDSARAQVHAEFALPAVALSDDGLQTVAINARLHRDIKKAFGDLESEGFALMVESHNEIIVDTREWVPRRMWTVDFGRGRVVFIDTVVTVHGDRYWKCMVSPEKPR